MSCISFNNLCPSSGDNEQVLLSKILQSLNEGGGGSGAGVSSISVNGGPAETGAVSLTIPPATTPLLNFTDESADQDAVIWRNAGTVESVRIDGVTGFMTFSGTRILRDVDDSAITLLGGTSKATSAFVEAYGQNHATGLGGITFSIHDNGAFRVRSAPNSSTASVVKITMPGASGFLGVGPQQTPAGLLHLNSEATAQFSILEQLSGDTSAFTQSFHKARGTLAAPAVIVSGDALGTIAFRGYDGTGYITNGGASIEAVSSGTIAGTRVPGELRFRTATNATPSVLTTGLTINSAQRCRCANDITAIGFYGGASADFSTYQTLLGTVGLRLPNSGYVAWSSTGSGSGLSDLWIFRDAAGVLALRNLTNAQTFRISETTDAGLTNYSRLSLQTQTSPGNILIRSEAAGTALVAGQPRILQVGTGPSAGTDIAGNSVIIHSGQGTGSGLRGAILFQQGTPGASGAGVGALATTWQINTSGHLQGSAGFQLLMNAPLRLFGYTVGTLPAGTVGDRAYVTDATAPAYNAALVGGGAVVVPVFFNGAAWVSA